MSADNLNAVSFAEPTKDTLAEAESSVNTLYADEMTSDEIESVKSAQLGLMTKIYDAHLGGSAREYYRYTPEKSEIKTYLEYYSTTNHACYDVVKGFETYKYVFANAENTDSQKMAADQLENYFGVKPQALNGRPIYVKSENVGYDIPQGFYYCGSDSGSRLYNALRTIALLPRKEIEVNSVLYMYSPAHILYSKQFFSIKIPVRKTINDVTNWDFVYLVHPSLSIEESSVELLTAVYGEASVSVFQEFTDAFTAFMSEKETQVFSLNYYLDLCKKVSHVDLCVKSLVNLIRRDSYRGAHTDYYRIVQESRMNHKERMACMRYTYNGAYKEMTFREFVEVNNLKLTDIDKLAAFPEKRNGYLEALNAPELEPLQLYVKHLTTLEFQDIQLMNDYEKYESARQNAALELWLAHARIKMNEPMFASYLHYVTSGEVHVDPFQDKVWYWTVDKYNNECLKVDRYTPRKPM